MAASIREIALEWGCVRGAAHETQLLPGRVARPCGVRTVVGTALAASWRRLATGGVAEQPSTRLWSIMATEPPESDCRYRAPPACAVLLSRMVSFTSSRPQPPV